MADDREQVDVRVSEGKHLPPHVAKKESMMLVPLIYAQHKSCFHSGKMIVSFFFFLSRRVAN